MVVVVPHCGTMSHHRLVFAGLVNWDRLFAAHVVDYIFSFIFWGGTMLNNAIVMELSIGLLLLFRNTLMLRVASIFEKVSQNCRSATTF